MKRILSTILLLSLLASVTASCGGDNGNEEDTTDTETAPPVEDTTPAGPTVNLPEDLDYTGTTIRVLTAEGILHGYKDERDDGKEASVMQQAMYEQFLATSERLGVEFEYIDVNPYQDAVGIIRQSIGAQSDDYDFCFTVANAQVNLINEGLYLPLSELPHIDLDQPWWNRGYIESVSLNSNTPYMLFGGITYSSVQRTAGVFFNKRLLEEIHGLSDMDIYNKVLDGTWTLDEFSKLTTGVYRDDGDTQQDFDDLHAITHNGAAAFNYFAFSAGLEYTTRDEDGYPVVNVNNETTINLADKLLGFFTGEDQLRPTQADNINYYVDKFGAGKALFICNRIFIAGWDHLRNMEDDFGIIPYPKLDETVDGYHCVVGDLVQWGGVPVTVQDPVMISAVAESLAFEGYNRVVPVYYESELKLKYTRGDVDVESQMLDIITQGARTDFIYLNKLGGVGNIFTGLYNAGQNNFSSLYAQCESLIKYNLDKLIADDIARTGE